MDSSVQILVVEDDQFALDNLMISLRKNKYVAQGLTTAEEALQVLRTNPVQVLVTDIKLPGMTGLDLVTKTKEFNRQLKNILITGYSEITYYEMALKLNVDVFLKKPYDEHVFLHNVQRLVSEIQLETENRRLKERLEKENRVLYRQIQHTYQSGTTQIVGKSTGLQQCLKQTQKVAKFGVNALICGESGTGKELVVRAIHHQSNGGKCPFVDINCATLSPTLVEEELFGHTRGAFTSAVKSKAGLLEVANGGILFLDEITEVAPEIQAKLLRVLETGSFRRIGSLDEQQTNIQILSSTNHPIREVLDKNLLREDLFHRLATVVIELPPLRERLDDFELLLDHFLEKYSHQFQQTAAVVPGETRKFLQSQAWPGNIRQLANFAQRWFLFGADASLEDVQNWLSFSKTPSAQEGLLFRFEKGNMAELLAAKKWLVERALLKSNGNKTHAAQHLGITYNGLLKMMRGFERDSDA